MSIRCSVFIATSLDGFIARDDGGLDWLNAAGAAVPAGEDCGYAAFMKSVDVLVMGRLTFDKVMSLGKWPYDEKPVVVLSGSAIEIPGELQARVSASSEKPADLVRRLSGDGAKHLYIDGGLVIQSFLNAGLIDALIITVVPVLLGSGRRLFGPLEGDIVLTYVATNVYDFGFVQHEYQVARPA